MGKYVMSERARVRRDALRDMAAQVDLASQPPAKVIPRRDMARGVTNFTPAGVGSACLYAVTLNEWPDVVKVGRSTSWRHRSKAYRNWNHSQGCGIMVAQVFEINEECVDLEALEAAVIAAMPFDLFRGREWFTGDVDGAAQVIQQLLWENEMFYTLHFDV